MKNKNNTYFHLISFCLFAILIISSAYISGCSAVSDTIKNAERLKFRLGKVDGFDLAGVKMKNFNSIKDFSILDGAKLLSAFSSGSMKSTFTVNLIAKNPDYAGGSKESSSLIKTLDWRLLIDNKEILEGAVNNITVPGVGQSVTIPIPVTVDLLKFIGDAGYENVINLALAIGGKSGNSSRLTLKIRPTIDTFFGGITYPGEIDVIDKEFR